MSITITRRDALARGLGTFGLLLGGMGIENAHAWPPGPSEHVKRDLTPGPMPFRLGSGFSPEKGKDPVVAVKKLREQGFTGVVTGTAAWDTLADSEIQAYKSALKTYDVVIYEVGSYLNIIHPDDAIRQENLKKVAHALEVAEKIGCPMVGTCTGSRDPDYYINVHPDNWTEETWALTIKSIRQILKDTAGMKAALGIEAQVTMNIDGPKAHKRLLDDVGDPRCAVNLDPTNMVSLGVYYHTTELINECFDLLGENILGCHAKDTYIWPDKQTVHVQEVCPGRGVMDYETYLVRMSRLKWPRTLLVEHIPAEQYPEAFAYIRKIADKVGVKIYS